MQLFMYKVVGTIKKSKINHQGSKCRFRPQFPVLVLGCSSFSSIQQRTGTGTCTGRLSEPVIGQKRIRTLELCALFSSFEPATIG
jgi:hypothetical protein